MTALWTIFVVCIALYVAAVAWLAYELANAPIVDDDPETAEEIAALERWAGEKQEAA